MISIGYNPYKDEIIFHSPLFTSMSLEFFRRNIKDIPKEYRILINTLRSLNIVPRFSACIVVVKASQFVDINQFYNVIARTLQEAIRTSPHETPAEFTYELDAEIHIKNAIGNQVMPDPFQVNPEEQLSKRVRYG